MDRERRWSNDDIVVDDAFRVPHDPEQDRKALDVLSAMEVPPETIDRVERFLAPKGGLHFHDTGILPWLPGYMIASELRRGRRKAELRPGMYRIADAADVRKTVAERRADLAGVAEVLDRREAAGDVQLGDARDAIREHHAWLDGLEKNAAAGPGGERDGG